MFKLSVLFCVLVLLVKIDAAYVKRDVESTTQSQILASFQKNMDMFRKCLDHTLASSVNDINVNQLQPVLSVIGDSVNRFSKAFEDLTAKSTTTEAWR
ncbi:uncharacterized protein LOC115454444 [Manduca sexta]|nr:uncharacterized protein LOC115454444 [Manduca sexta]